MIKMITIKDQINTCNDHRCAYVCVCIPTVRWRPCILVYMNLYRRACVCACTCLLPTRKLLKLPGAALQIIH